MKKQFGQEVVVTIEDKNGRSILVSNGQSTPDSSGLRVDFDVRYLDGFGRAKVVLWNLNEETIGNMIGGNEDHYLSLSVRLHGGDTYQLMDSFFISNTLDEKKIPNTITSLYCYDRVKKDILERPVNLKVAQPCLANVVEALLQATGYKGTPKYQSFPDEQQFYLPRARFAPVAGSVQECISDLKREHGFNWYASGKELLFLYKPDLNQVTKTNLAEQKVITLNTNNMRANPVLAPAQLTISSNLDAALKPGSVLDISKLLTAGVNANADELEISENFLRDSVAGYNLYQALTVQHKGSNYTDEWHTNVYAVAPTNGKAMRTQTWFK